MITASSTRTAACCTSCDWTAPEQLMELTVRVCARKHVDRTGHTVAVLASTVTTYEAAAGPETATHRRAA